MKKLARRMNVESFGPLESKGINERAQEYEEGRIERKKNMQESAETECRRTRR